jgi:hypothetical protein
MLPQCAMGRMVCLFQRARHAREQHRIHLLNVVPAEQILSSLTAEF